MKSIEIFIAEKYKSFSYQEVEKGIYNHENKFVMSLSFIQEPEFGEGISSAHISQYPLEDVLEKYLVFVSDFYREINNIDSKKCYLEFCSPNLCQIHKLKDIVGKHVYNTEIKDGNKIYVQLVIE